MFFAIVASPEKKEEVAGLQKEYGGQVWNTAGKVGAVLAGNAGYREIGRAAVEARDTRLKIWGTMLEEDFAWMGRTITNMGRAISSTMKGDAAHDSGAPANAAEEVVAGVDAVATEQLSAETAVVPPSGDHVDGGGGASAAAAAAASTLSPPIAAAGVSAQPILQSGGGGGGGGGASASPEPEFLPGAAEAVVLAQPTPQSGGDGGASAAAVAAASTPPPAAAAAAVAVAGVSAQPTTPKSDGDGEASAAAAAAASTPPPAAAAAAGVSAQQQTLQSGGGGDGGASASAAADTSTLPPPAAAAGAGTSSVPSQLLPQLTDVQEKALDALLKCLAKDMPFSQSAFLTKTEALGKPLEGSHPLQRILVTATRHLKTVRMIMARSGAYVKILVGYCEKSTKALETWAKETPPDQREKEITLLCGELKKAGFTISDEEMKVLLAGKLTREVDKMNRKGQKVGTEEQPIYPEARDRGHALWLYLIAKAPKA